MKYDVSIPVLVREHLPPGEGGPPKEWALAVRFEIDAKSEQEAARILYERLEPYCADP